MVAAVLLASFAPQIGATDGPLHLGAVADFGVSLVFFLSGAGLSLHKLKAGVMNWRLHLFVQIATFVLFPILGVLGTLALRPYLPADMLVGFFFLCALPSTISTSIAMTALARGNVAGAIFNATVSALIGVVATPVLVQLWLHTDGQGSSLAEQFLAIGKQLILPFVVGQLLRPLIGGWMDRHKPITSKIDRTTILLIVFNSFSDSVQEGLWTRFGLSVIAQALIIAVVLLAVVLTLTTLASRWLGFTVEDEIAAVFCGSKKSMATGIPMAKLLFAGSPALGLIVLPVMFYHQIQLIVGSVLAQRYARRPEAEQLTLPAGQ